MNKRAFMIAGLVLVLGLGILIAGRMPAPAQSSNALPTQALFAASFADANGQTQALKQWQGKIIVLNFWATWCPPCREEMPELSALHTQYQAKNVVVLGIAIDDANAVKEFSKETPMSYPLLIAEDAGMEISANLGNDKGALPYTVIIKADGTVANTYFGRITKPLLEETLNTLF